MLTKKLILPFLFLVSTSIQSASDMESVLEVGRETLAKALYHKKKLMAPKNKLTRL